MSMPAGAPIGASICPNCNRILMFTDPVTCPGCSRWKELILREVFIPIEDLELNETDEEYHKVLRTYGVPLNKTVKRERLFEETDGREGVLFKWNI